MCGKYLRKTKTKITKIMQKAQDFLVPIEAIKIPDIFYKIQKFLKTSLASVVTHKNLLDLIIWM
jgi:hypothetical protein